MYDSDAPQVYIIVLNWNQYQLTADCVRSLTTLNYQPYQIVVVDNGSQDGTVEKLRAEFGDQIGLIANPENLGFAGGNNVGIHYALAQNAKYVMLLNNDTIANDPELVSKLVTVAEQDPSVGLASPSIYYMDNPGQMWFAGSALSLWTGLKHYSQFPVDRTPSDTGWATGCCVLASAKMIRQIGPLLEAYFLYMEDVEWSLRAKRAGWRVVYVPEASLLHKERATSGDPGGTYSPSSVYYVRRNMIWFVRQYGNFVQCWLVWPVILGFTWAYLICAYIALRRWPKLKALLSAIHDGLLTLP